MKFRTSLFATFGMLTGFGLLTLTPAYAATATVAPAPAAPAHSETAAQANQHWMRQAKMPVHKVAVVQEALDSTGANLKIDGTWGPATEAALKSYQHQAGLPVTGRLDHATWKRLDPVG